MSAVRFKTLRDNPREHASISWLWIVACAAILFLMLSA